MSSPRFSRKRLCRLTMTRRSSLGSGTPPAQLLKSGCSNVTEVRERTETLDVGGAVRRLKEGGSVVLSRAPEGFDAFIVAELTRALAEAGENRAATLVFVARDSLRAQ